MLKALFKSRIAVSKMKKQNAFTDEDIKNAETVLFSVFSRYGDSIVSFKIMQEFIQKWPEKKIILLTPKQFAPYAQALLPSHVSILAFNKRNPIALIYVLITLLFANSDIAFNPWSYGFDAEFFSTFAKKYYDYKQFDVYPKQFNLYDRVRVYLGFSIQKEKHIVSDFVISDTVQHILVAPISSNIQKNVEGDDLKKLIQYLSSKYPDSKITLALPSNKYAVDIRNVDEFIFAKKQSISQKFLVLCRECDLFVGVDSGPMHLALSLGKPCYGLFGSHAPGTIINDNDKIKIFRHPRLSGLFCDIRECKNPECIHKMFDNLGAYQTLLDPTVRLEVKQCVLV